MTFYNFGIEIEVIVEPHNKQRPVPAPIQNDLELWYGKLAAAMRNRKGCDQQPLQAVAQLSRKAYREQNGRHGNWWITWDGSLVSPEWPRHPGGRFNLVLQEGPVNDC